MKVLDVINSALKIIGEYDFLEYLQSEGEESLKFKRDKELLLEAYNAAMLTVTEYYPLSLTETLTAVDGKIEFSALKFNPYKIRKVGSNKAYKILPTRIDCEGEVTMTYSYLPKAETIDEEFHYASTPVTALAVSYGVLSEYLLYKNRFEEAVTYGDKFINAISAVNKYKKQGKLKSREWF